jgi:hypothetical protein
MSLIGSSGLDVDEERKLLEEKKESAEQGLKESEE